MSGFFLMHRGWRDNEIFKGEFSRADAWVWLIENACWKPTRSRIKGQTVELDRGEMSFSQRFLAEKWGWSKSRVDRFIAELRDEGMIETRSKIGATAGHSAGQGQSILRVCNYSKYQDMSDASRGNDDPETGATAGQQRGKEEQGNNKTNNLGGGASAQKQRGPYAFEGKVIKLNQADFDRWSATYHAIPDLRAELSSFDVWWVNQPEVERKRWFSRTEQNLNRKHQAAVANAVPGEPANFQDYFRQKRLEERELARRRAEAGRQPA